MSREVLAPPLMRMKPNRCYRVNVVHEDFASQSGVDVKAQQGSSRNYAEEDLYGEEYNDELDAEVESLVEEAGSGTFKLAMHVASPFYGGIIGHKGSTKRRIESEAQCDITIPQRSAQNNSNSNLIIKAKIRNNVFLARRKILLLVTSMRKRMKITHFYGVALNFGVIRENFIDLKNQIMAAELPGIEESIFQGENRIHLTFGTCVLMDERERARAAEILQSCRELIQELKPPFNVHVSGLEIMNDDPSSVRVLYAPVVASDELQLFANRCFERFNQSGLGFDDFERGCVKLHMTVMNIGYCNSDKKSFDAREILKRWGNFEFGSVQCNELVLCVCGAANKDRSAFYKITDSLKF